MTFEEKIKELGAQSLAGIQAIAVEIEPGLTYEIECSRFDFVVWRDKVPFFYKRKFIEEHEVKEIQLFIDSQIVK